MNRSTMMVGLIVVLFLGAMTLYTVQQNQRAMLFRLGEIVDENIEPGLHFKLPFVNNVRTFDMRILTLDAEPERFLTAEKKNVIVDFFVKWRIENLAAYYKATAGGDERLAASRLGQILKDGLRSEFSKRSIQEVVSGDRSQIMEVLTLEARREAVAFGIAVEDVRIRKIDLPAAVSSSVFSRMEAERARVAKDFRARGAEAAERIRADADRQRSVLLAEAYRDAERIRGEGDARSAEIYADAYGKNAEFYDFYRSLDAYVNTFSDKNDIIVVKPDSDFFQYFGDSKGRR